MSLQVHSLASGSSGNAMVVRGKHGDLLIDCGMTRAFIEASLAALGGTANRLRAVLLTHEHTDHARGAVALARRYAIPVVASEGTLQRVVGTRAVQTAILSPLEPLELGEFHVTAYPVSHDAQEPVALAIQWEKVRVCYAVDLGRVEAPLLQACSDAALVILEANHDVNRLIHGPYDAHLKERILSHKGHLSNDDAARVMAEVSSTGQHTAFWLAHLSAINNSPRAALRAGKIALSAGSRSHCSVEVALRDRPSLSWTPGSHWWQPSLSLW